MLRKLTLKQKKNGFLIKKTCNYTEKDSTKNRVVLVKTDRLSKIHAVCAKVVIPTQI